MRREVQTPRPHWRAEVERLGLVFHTFAGKPYWNEEAAYVFSMAEVETLERATNDLHAMCLEAVERVIQRRDYARFAIPEAAHAVIERAWELDPPAVYGRFDLCFDGVHPPKMLEYNADTPTSLLEAAIVQWHWLQAVSPGADQFNSIWEGLVEKWRALKEEGLMGSDLVHFACMNVPEDLMTTAVLMDAAQEAGLRPYLMPMTEITWDNLGRRFVDKFHRDLETCFKLYPWEWMVAEEFGPMALETYGRTQWVEPIWKMILSNKAILAVLWEMYPDHPNLLPAYLDGPHDLTSYVRKPILGREGSNVSVVSPTLSAEADGPYGEEGFVYQTYAPLPTFDGHHTVIGSWVIDGEARGIGIRESDGPITEDTSRFVPHRIEGC